jgi:hypothetical protein
MPTGGGNGTKLGRFWTQNASFQMKASNVVTMNSLQPSFDSILARWNWREINGCPGRYVLDQDARLTVAEVVGLNVAVRECTLPNARDPVLVVMFDGGGLISYRRPNGECVHTLNTAEGLDRKLVQRGLNETRSPDLFCLSN